MELDKRIKRQYILKEKFKSDDLYKYGVIFLNERKEKSRLVLEELSPSIRDKLYTVTLKFGVSGLSRLMTDVADQDSRIEIHTASLTIKEIATINFAIVYKALLKYPAYKFENLKKIFPTLRSTREFITNEKFLGSIKLNIKSLKENF